MWILLGYDEIVAPCYLMLLHFKYLGKSKNTNVVVLTIGKYNRVLNALIFMRYRSKVLKLTVESVGSVLSSMPRVDAKQ